MGKYYAQAQGEDEAVARAIEEHYKPLGPNDRVPTDPVSIAVALADKLDMLVGFWAINEKPTGSKDPYGLRRAALGAIRIIIENELRLPLRHAAIPAFIEVAEELKHLKLDRQADAIKKLRDVGLSSGRASRLLNEFENLRLRRQTKKSILSIIYDLLDFFDERLSVQLRARGVRHDVAEAVFAMADEDDLVLIVRRVEALGKFLDTEDGKNLLAGYKRATNIIRIEEKKDARDYVGRPDPSLYRQDEEWALAKAIDAAKADAAAAVAREDFAAAMSAMAKLRPPVDAFFDKVTVNVEDKPVRENRLRLLNEIREATRAVADFSRIEG